ncbi:Bug family tripartite tricarboxylate transporter substrate binding protein [Falsiroseomonas oryziterrae]|uniref:Bug family tripartite tricarboxylate transporter substrate binding protein n=1 Tax=Falsiroseomonas oryziterrae TaxID=2911368 RepID=UPI001F213BEB|nr:tripartite tricarboxylate transporter substrate binding protein [Roseomonas sp. NPKOSM-4]
MTHLSRRALLGAAGLAALPTAVHAQEWTPPGPVRLINPFAPGGSPDILARVMAPHMQGFLGQPMVVENRPGAGAAVGTRSVARAAADGTTVLLAPISSVIAAFMMREPGYELSDFRPVSHLATTPFVLVVRPGRFANVQEWDRHMKANPGRMTGATGGSGTPHQLAAELYRQASGTDFQLVAYRGTAPALTDLRAGTVDFMFADMPAALGQVRQGGLQALAVCTLNRVPVLPDTPTMAESVAPGFDANSWVMWWVPAATPDPVARRLSAAARHGLAQPDVVARANDVGFVLVGSDMDGAARHLRSEVEKWSGLIRARGLVFEEA